MHHRNLRALAIPLAIIMTCAALPWARAQTVSPVIPGVSIADIPLGMRISEVVARLGAPSEVRLVGTDGTLAYVFGKYGITTYTRGKVVVAVSTTNSLLGGARGVGLLAPEDAVRLAFGAPRSTGVVEGYPGLLYDGIGFGLDRHTVAVVMVFPSVSQAAPSTPPPPETPSPSLSPQATPDENPTSSTTGATTVPGQGPAAPETPVPSAVTTPSGTAPLSGASETAAPDTKTPAGPARASTAAVPPAPEAPAASAAAVTPTVSDDASTPTDDQAALALAAMMVAAGPAPMTGAPTTPDLSRLHPFTGETKYLSLFGYIRFLIYKVTKQWIGFGR